MDECIDAYLDLSKEVFKVDQLLAGHAKTEANINGPPTIFRNIVVRKHGPQMRPLANSSSDKRRSYILKTNVC